MPEKFPTSHHPNDAWRATAEGKNLQKEFLALKAKVDQWDKYMKDEILDQPPQPTIAEYKRLIDVIQSLQLLQKTEGDKIRDLYATYKKPAVVTEPAEDESSEEESGPNLPDYWTPEHTKTINEALGFTGQPMLETTVPTLEDVDNLSDAYKDNMYPVTQPETEKYISKRPSWFKDSANEIKNTDGQPAFPGLTYWEVYKRTMEKALHILGGATVFIDRSLKPNYTNGTQVYQPEPLQRHLQEYFGSPHRFNKKYENSENVGKSIDDPTRTKDILGFLHYLKRHIITTLKAKGLMTDEQSCDITVTLPPATLMNQLMTNDPHFQPSSKTSTWEWTCDEIRGSDRVLMVGHSGLGGASCVGDWGRGEALGNRGFRPAVIVRQSA